MSTATPPLPVRPAPSAPHRPSAAPAAAPAAMSGFANIDPVRLLRRYWPLLAAAAVLGAVLGTAGHFALLRTRPKYTASVTFQCSPPRTNIFDRAGTGASQTDFDRYMGTQMAIMTSYEVLTNALRNPDVAATQWARQFMVNGNFQPVKAITHLQDSLSPRLVPQTTLVRLSISGRRREDVRTLVDAVASAYMQEVRKSTNDTTVEQRAVLEKRRIDVTDEIKNLNTTRDALLVKGQITNLGGGVNKEEQQQAQITKDLIEVQGQLASIRSLRQRIKDQAQDNGTITFPQDMVEQAQADPVIAGMTREMSALKVDELSMKQQGLGDGHLACISLRNRYKATQARYNDELKIVLQRIHDSNVEGYAKSEESLAAREKKLEDELKTTTDRKRDLLAITGKIDQIDNQMIELTAELQRVNASRENLELLSNNAVFDQVRVMIPAQTPSSVSFPKLMMMLPLGVLLVTGLTAGVVLLREIMDQRVKGPADVAMIPRLRVLGMIPDAAEDPARPGSVETAFRDTPGGVVTESFRQVRAPLVKKMDTEGHRTVLVLAGMPGSGATTVACNLAIGCAAADDRVLIIDANVRRPAMGRIFGLSDPLGLADCLAGQTTLAEAVRPTSVPNLSVLVAGSPGNRMAPERLSSESMSRLLAEAAAGFDRVFIDCPPAIVSGDGLALANRCDAVVMVVRAMNEKRGLVNRVRMQLSESRAELIGVIVNAVKSSAGGYFKRNIQATHEYHNPAKA